MGDEPMTPSYAMPPPSTTRPLAAALPLPGLEPTTPVEFENTELAFAARTPAELTTAKWVFRAMKAPRWFTRAGMGATRFALSTGIPGVEAALKKTVFSVFCGGATLEEVAATVAKLAAHGVASILDYAVEGEKDEAGFDAAREELIRTVRFAEAHPSVGFCALKMSSLAPTPAMTRAQAGEPLSSEETLALERGQKRLEAVASEAHARRVPIFIDAEESWIQGSIDLYAERLMREHNRGGAIVYTTLQMYRRDSGAHLARLIDDAKASGYIAGIKLVRGAYIEKETARARARGYDNPIHATKADSDEAFDRGLDLCLANIDHVALCAATHNQASLVRLTDGMAHLGLSRKDPRITIAQLLGMADRLTFPLAKAGFNTLKYLPFGPVVGVFPYLARRAEENNSVAQQATGELRRVEEEIERRKRGS